MSLHQPTPSLTRRVRLSALLLFIVVASGGSVLRAREFPRRMDVGRGGTHGVNALRASASASHGTSSTRRALTPVAPFVVLPSAVFAQQDRCAHKFLSFPRNSLTVRLKGRLKGKACLVYRLNAREGQMMTVHLAGRGAEFRVSYDPGVCCTPEGSIGDGVSDWSGELPVTGHYDVFVTPTGENSGVPYTLEITVK